MKVLGVVPARGGSKGVFRKNLKLLNGEPLIAHSLNTAKRVSEIDELVVSTEDQEISRVSQNYGVKVVNRPVELATDEATTESAVLNVIEFFEAENKNFDIALILEPTSPFRTKRTIVQAIHMLKEGEFSSIVAVRETRENIGFVENNCFSPLINDAPRRRQMRKPFYIESSTIYSVSVPYLKQTKSLVSDNWGALLVDGFECLDINTEEDFRLAEYLMKDWSC